VRFPAESHELSRSGSPAHRTMRFALILDWFARNLRPEETRTIGQAEQEPVARA
jgi:hypothetical protein